MADWNVSASPATMGVERGRKLKKAISVPPEFQRVTYSSERELLVKDLLLKTGCVVVPHWEQGKIYRFDIYGSDNGVERAVGDINRWISQAHAKSKDSTAWAKLPAFNADEWYYDRVTQMEGDRKQIFLGPVPELSDDSPRPPSIIVDWPEDLRNHLVTPRDVFGNKLQKLNGLRMRDEVFITLLPNSNVLWQVEIMGFDINNVEVAVEHYQTMIKKVRADTLGLNSSLNIILDEGEGIEVAFEEAGNWWPNHTDRVVPRLLPSPMMYDPGNFRRDGLHFTQLSAIQRSIEQALEVVRHTRGSYDFAVRLGCLVLSSKKVSHDQIGKTRNKEEFSKAINSRVDIVVKKWTLDNKLGLEVLHRFTVADHLLEPTKAGGYYGYMPTTLKQTRPMFRGTWVFRDPNSSVLQTPAPARHSGRPAAAKQSVPAPNVAAPPIGLIVVQIDWTDDEHGLYEKMDTRFYRLEPGKSVPKINMDINLLELGDGRGWQFALESLTQVPQKLVSPTLTNFADRVKMRPNYDLCSEESFAQWEQIPTVKRHLQSGRLDKIYLFGLQKTGYVVELTAMWYPQQRKPVWGIGVRHREWATHLAELERLLVGSKADWGHTLTTFLPDDGLSSCANADDDEFGMDLLKLDDKHNAPARNGIRILMEKLMQISEIVSSVTSRGDSVSL